MALTDLEQRQRLRIAAELPPPGVARALDWCHAGRQSYLEGPDKGVIDTTLVGQARQILAAVTTGERDQLDRPVGAQLAALRAMHNLTLRDVEARTKISRGYLWQLERGARAFTVGHILALARLYGRDPRPFLRRGLLERLLWDSEIEAFLHLLDPDATPSEVRLRKE